MSGSEVPLGGSPVPGRGAPGPVPSLVTGLVKRSNRGSPSPRKGGSPSLRLGVSPHPRFGGVPYIWDSPPPPCKQNLKKNFFIFLKNFFWTTQADPGGGVVGGTPLVVTQEDCLVCIIFVWNRVFIKFSNILPILYIYYDLITEKAIYIQNVPQS